MSRTPELDPREDPEAEEGEPLPEIASLSSRGDVDGLLALARAHRTGDGVPRDLRACLEAYRAASELGSADAAYAVALFYLSGGVVPQDLKEGAAHLRTAAERGSTQAKVYVANLYELGVHYKADAEKADVWYRNAARAAGLEGDGEAFDRKMAELGCVRHYLALSEAGVLAPEEDAAFASRAKAHGYLLKLREDRASTFDPLADARMSALPGMQERPRAADESQGPAAKAEARAPDAKPGEPEREASPRAAKKDRAEGGDGTVKRGLAAFAYALLFMATGAGAGFAAMRGAEALVARGDAIPGLGARADLVLPIVLGIVGALPAFLVYRAGAVVKALLAAALFAGVGWVAWGTGEGALVASRAAQTIAFAAAGFLAALAVLGFMGGAKGGKPAARAR